MKLTAEELRHDSKYKFDGYVYGDTIYHRLIINSNSIYDCGIWQEIENEEIGGIAFNSVFDIEDINSDIFVSNMERLYVDMFFRIV